ncbi:DUF3426 domain-containing protein [Rhodocyclaceae bacterium SMB388]
MMIARCPACQTVFRARSEQLQAHGGMVRCGQCFAPFNALEHVIEATVSAAGDAIPLRADVQTSTSDDPLLVRALDRANEEASIDSGTPDSPGGDTTDRNDLSVHDLSDDALEYEPVRADDAWRADARAAQPRPVFEPLGEGLDFEFPAPYSPRKRYSAASDDDADNPEHAPPEALRSDGSPARARADLGVGLPPSRGDTPEPEASGAGFDRGDAWSDVGVEDTPEHDVDAKAATTDTSARQAQAANHAGVDDGAGAPDYQPPPVRHHPRAAAHVKIDRPDRDFSPYTKPKASGVARWMTGLLVGILMGTLAAQAAYLFRMEITRSWPELRPLYLRVCAQLGCDVPLPQVASAIRITSSDLESDPADPSRMVLNARVLNQAAHPQAYPHLEITLTDARDRPVVRRVLAPDEWVGTDRPENGFGASKEIVVRLPFGTSGVVDATGYRVYAFFP